MKDFTSYLQANAQGNHEGEYGPFTFTYKELSAGNIKTLVEFLKSNQVINELNLSGQKIGDRGAKLLAELLGHNATITTLTLDECEIGDEGAIALAEALKNGSSLTKLSLKKNAIGSRGGCALAEAAANRTLTHLNLAENEIGNSVAHVVREMLRSKNCALESLNLNSIGVEDTFSIILADGLRYNTSLREVDIGGSDFRINNYQSNNDAATIALILKENKTLIKLSIVRCSFGAPACQMIFNALEDNKSLMSLDIGNNKIDTAGAHAAAQLLKNNMTLTDLRVSSGNMDWAAIRHISHALQHNTTLTNLDISNNPIDKGTLLYALDGLLANNQSLRKLYMRGNSFADYDAVFLAEQLKKNKSLVHLDTGVIFSTFTEKGDETILDAVAKGGSKNLVKVGLGRTYYGDAERLLRANDSEAYRLAREIVDAPNELTVEDFVAIKERLPAIIYKAENFLQQGWEHEFVKLPAIAAAHGIEITLPKDVEMLASITPPPQLTWHEYRKKLNAEEKAVYARITTIMNSHDVTIKELIGRDFDEAFSMDELETLLAMSRAASNQPLTEASNITRARFELVNHEIIPHVDYFVMAALHTIGKPEEIDFSKYPNLQQVAGTEYDLSRFKQQERSKQPANATAKFDYLLDTSQGDHMTRLHRALAEVNGDIAGYEDTFKAIEAQITSIYTQIDEQRGVEVERRDYLKDAKKGNEFRTDRMHEYGIRSSSILSSAQARNRERTKATFWQSVTYGVSKISKGVPFLEGIAEAISESVGHPNYFNNKATIKSTLAGAEVEARAAQEVIDYYGSKQIDTAAIEREIATIRDGMEKLKNNADYKRFEQDKTKQKAVAEAFVNKLMLNFGQHMSNNLLAVCEENGIEKIDDFLAAFESDPRLKEAFTNLSFGFADSNDLSIIFAEAASFKDNNSAHTTAREFVEMVLKPNIDDLYAHASKVDLIYQANLSHLGTELHNARHMIRSEHDLRVQTLFGDSFGIDSQMGSLTIRGAVDVKNLFDYYMHRHGNTTLTDTKIHDGCITGNKAPKRVNWLDDTEMAEHTELAKSSRGYRQEGPDISDMFLRICGYEYFVPQAPNDALRSNIMANNPEAPASYLMVNHTVKNFIQKLSFSHIDDYRSKVGTTNKTPSKLDNLLAQTFMDFFSEVGSIHAADPKLGRKRADLKSAAKETGTFGFAFDSYERLITKDASSRFDLFLNIYKRNLETQLRDGSAVNGKLLLEQIANIAELTQQQLNPSILLPGDEEHRHRARYENHSFANTHWRE